MACHPPEKPEVVFSRGRQFAVFRLVTRAKLFGRNRRLYNSKF